ncbi:chondroitin sulfate N-acetylgalactosaminyltransferase 1-like [Penaeus chinensis]|uniref:chondroitin sulfate N-acetylgalactosaminyltransferase 1-like n=1 Tax=Penaeus chinensis TaxID=139456 RepID=UPI001FB5A7F3|nr:chondroitin sulfate N-acetylgalactosaminyltransferase 1-like [Penaeus chinensis]
MGHDVRQRLTQFLVLHGPFIRLGLRLALLSGSVVAFLVVAARIVISGDKGVPWNPFARDSRTVKDWSQMSYDCKRGWVDDPVTFSQDPNYPRIRDWVNDHIYFNIFDGTTVYDNQDSTKGTVSRGPHKEEVSMFSRVQERAVRFLDGKYPDRYSAGDCAFIRYRTLPTTGIEVDVTCRDSRTGDIDRVSMLAPLESPRVLYHHLVAGSRPINIIMPLKGRPDNLQIFMQNLENILSKDNRLSVGLTVVYFKDDDQQECQRILQKAEKSFPNLKTEFILQEGPFSRGRGLQVGVEKTTLRAEIVFFCDVDVLFTKEFLTRCQSTPVEGYQVFFPMVFSMYNPEFIYPLHKHRIPPPLHQLEVNDNNGYWRVWGHGMVCIYKSDFFKIGGFDMAKSGWGGEDLDLVRKTVRVGKYKIIRSLEPGLFHRYHSKECDDARQFFPCIKTKALNEASKLSFGLWYFKQKHNVSVYGFLAEGNKPHDHDDYDPARNDTAPLAVREIMNEFGVLVEMLLLLVLLSIVLVDMFFMYNNYKLERKNT